MTPGTAQSGLAQGKCPPNIEEPPPRSICAVPAPRRYTYVCTFARVCVLICAHTVGAGVQAFHMLKEPPYAGRVSTLSPFSDPSDHSVESSVGQERNGSDMGARDRQESG